MIDIEFEILDELYFVQPFDYLQKNTPYTEQEILDTLKIFLQKDWIRIYDETQKEIIFTKNIVFEDNFEKNYKFFYYLATKAGLKAHTTI